MQLPSLLRTFRASTILCALISYIIAVGVYGEPTPAGSEGRRGLLRWNSLGSRSSSRDPNRPSTADHGLPGSVPRRSGSGRSGSLDLTRNVKELWTIKSDTVTNKKGQQELIWTFFKSRIKREVEASVNLNLKTGHAKIMIIESMNKAELWDQIFNRLETKEEWTFERDCRLEFNVVKSMKPKHDTLVPLLDLRFMAKPIGEVRVPTGTLTVNVDDTRKRDGLWNIHKLLEHKLKVKFDLVAAQVIIQTLNPHSPNRPVDRFRFTAKDSDGDHFLEISLADRKEYDDRKFLTEIQALCSLFFPAKNVENVKETHQLRVKIGRKSRVTMNFIVKPGEVKLSFFISDIRMNEIWKDSEMDLVELKRTHADLYTGRNLAQQVGVTILAPTFEECEIIVKSGIPKIFQEESSEQKDQEQTLYSVKASAPLKLATIGFLGDHGFAWKIPFLHEVGKPRIQIESVYISRNQYEGQYTVVPEWNLAQWRIKHEKADHPESEYGLLHEALNMQNILMALDPSAFEPQRVDVVFEVGKGDPAMQITMYPMPKFPMPISQNNGASMDPKGQEDKPLTVICYYKQLDQVLLDNIRTFQPSIHPRIPFRTMKFVKYRSIHDIPVQNVGQIAGSAQKAATNGGNRAEEPEVHRREESLGDFYIKFGPSTSITHEMRYRNILKALQDDERYVVNGEPLPKTPVEWI